MTRGAGDDPRLLPPASGGELSPVPPAESLPAAVDTGGRGRQLGELPKDELDHLAEEFGIDSGIYQTRQHLVAALHDRRQAIAAMDRDAMLDVVKWGRRPVSINATKEQLAQEIAKIRSMRFAGLSRAGLLVLARMRGVRVDPTDPVPHIVKRLRKQEGLFSRLNRKRRAVLGSIVSSIIGEDVVSDYQFLPPQQTSGTGNPAAQPSSPQAQAQARAASLREEIEDEGLFGGITGRIKRSADSYLNQKLDEIEARIDRKLDEIDRRLGEWRDKEVANRIRILKITLWASVIVAAFSLIYSYVKVYFVR
jgi:hypothetical protein